MLMLRLTRVGKIKMPSYRLIVSEKTKDPWGDYLENLGTVETRVNPVKVQLNVDRIKYWISKGAQSSATVNNLLIDQQILTGEKVKKVSMSKRRAIRMAEKKAKEV